LFGVERLELHAETLAAAQPVTNVPPKVKSLQARSTKIPLFCWLPIARARRVTFLGSKANIDWETAQLQLGGQYR
jgi:hypothetical protein